MHNDSPSVAIDCEFDSHRRALLTRTLVASGTLSTGVGSLFVATAAHASAKTVTVSLPGPYGSISLPFDLASKLGLDVAEGVKMRLRFVGGGGLVIQDLDTGNADYGAFGLPAAVAANAKGPDRLVAIAAYDNLPLYSLLVRQDRRTSIRRVADLKGRKIGVFSNSLTARTTSHQVLEFVLRAANLSQNEVDVIAIGQTYDSQSAAFIAQSVDASMCDEPIATRLVNEKLAVEIYASGNPNQRVPGLGFLRGVLCTRRSSLMTEADTHARVVRMLSATLKWMDGNPTSRWADVLGLMGTQRQSLLDVGARYGKLYRSDTKFSRRQLADTQIFVRASNQEIEVVRDYPIERMIEARWSGVTD
jgi:NitT/TauT family transport system substrate-binding protein